MEVAALGSGEDRRAPLLDPDRRLERAAGAGIDDAPPPPRYPLLTYYGVPAPAWKWRAAVVPRPPGNVASATNASPGCALRPTPPQDGRMPDGLLVVNSAARTTRPVVSTGVSFLLPSPGDDPEAPPNVLTVQHWRRLLDGLLLARSPRLDWATLLRRRMDIDALDCPRCHGRLRALAVVTDPDQARRILQAAGLPAEPPPRARVRDPKDE